MQIFLTANADRRPWDSHWLNKGGGREEGGGTRRRDEEEGPLAQPIGSLTALEPDPVTGPWVYAWIAHLFYFTHLSSPPTLKVNDRYILLFLNTLPLYGHQPPWLLPEELCFRVALLKRRQSLFGLYTKLTQELSFLKQAVAQAVALCSSFFEILKPPLKYILALM